MSRQCLVSRPATPHCRGSELTRVDLPLIIHVHLQEPDEHAEEDPQELQVGAGLPHLREACFFFFFLVGEGRGGDAKEKRDEISHLGSWISPAPAARAKTSWLWVIPTPAPTHTPPPPPLARLPGPLPSWGPRAYLRGGRSAAAAGGGRCGRQKRGPAGC